MVLSKQQLKAIHAKNGSGISSRSHKTSSKQTTIKRPARKPAIIIPKSLKLQPGKFPKGDFRNLLSEQDIKEWKDATDSEVVSATKGKFEGRETIEVKFQNGENWFEFQTVRDQTEFFEKNFEKNEKLGEFIQVDHPKIEGYVNLLSGFSLFKDRKMEK